MSYNKILYKHYFLLYLHNKVIESRLAGPSFVWFFPGWLRANWWAAVGENDCTAEEMSKALEHTLGGLGIGVVDNDPSRILVSNKV